MTWARAEAPPTVANVGPGFEAVGLAVPAPGDIVWIRRRPEPGISLTIRGDGGKLPRAPERNSASAAAAELLRLVDAGGGLEMVLEKRLPTGGSGLGSSGASSAAAVAATASLLGEVAEPDLFRAAAKGEEIACGSPHLDNVVPALLGGLILLTPEGEALRLPTPTGLELAIARPDAKIPTAEARKVLPTEVPTKVATDQAMSLAGLVHALHTGDLALLGRSLVDRIAAPARAHLLPEYQAVCDRALAAGALGVSMSGSGPAVFALCKTGEASQVAAAMVEAWADGGYASEIAHAGGLSGPGAMDSVHLDAPPSPG